MLIEFHTACFCCPGMAFWGIKLEPGKSFIHSFDKTKGRLHITQATLDINCDAVVETSAVRCIVGAKDPVLLCALLPSMGLSCPLDLDFEEQDDVVFSVIGPQSVYLTGFYIRDCFWRNVIVETNKVEVGENYTKKDAKEGRYHGSKRRSHSLVQDVGLKKKCFRVPEQPEDSSAPPATEIGHGKISKSKKAYISKPKVGKTGNINSQRMQDRDGKVSLGIKENKESAVETNGNNAEEVPLDTRTFTNGMVIEELKFGDTHNSKVALPGSKVTVNYVGKLKTDGKLFDSNDDGAPYQFRLGVGKVIKGWDIGVNGMRVGDRRRITIPPALGYGSKGASRKYHNVPANASLVYDIEVIDVS